MFFEGNIAFKKISIPEGIKLIPSQAFKNCEDLEEITLPKGLECIKGDAFMFCYSLSKIALPESIKTIGRGAFRYSDIREIKISYNNYENLLDLIMSEPLFKEAIELNFKPVKLVFIGPKLSLAKKIKIKKKITNYHLYVEFIDIEEVKDIENNSQEIKSIDDEISNLARKIDELCNKLPENSKNLVKKRLNQLENNYKEELIEEQQKLTPKVTLVRTNSINLTTSSLGSARKKYIYNLESMLSGLSREKVLISLLQEIDGYRCLLNTTYDNMTNNESIEDIIKSLIYLSTKVDNKTGKLIINRINSLLDNPNNEYNNLINNLVNNKPTLVLESSTDPKMELHMNLSNLLDETIKYEEKLRPYLELLNTLKSNNQIYENNSSINNMIPQIRNIISRMQVEENKNKLNNNFNKICGLFIKKIENEINAKTRLNKDNYLKLEIELREVLQPFLEELNINANIDSEVKIQIDTIEYLSKVLKCIENKLYNEEFENIEMPPGFVKVKAIDSYLNDIYEKIINSNLIENDKKNILTELTHFILKCNRQELNTQNINEVINSILIQLAEIDYDLNNILNEKYIVKN